MINYNLYLMKQNKINSIINQENYLYNDIFNRLNQ